MKKQRLLSFILAALMTATACGSAGQTGKETDPSGTTSQEETTVGETGRAQAKDALPDKKYNGAEFTILYRDEWSYEFFAEEENGDIINDAVLKRNRAVEDRFDVKLNLYGVHGTYDAAEFRDAVKTRCSPETQSTISSPVTRRI